MDKKSATSSYKGKTLSLEYESGSKSNAGSMLSEQQSPPPLLPSLSYTMSQHGSINYKLLAQQQQKQLVVLYA